MSPEQRLRFHQEYTEPSMKGLHEWMKAQLAEHKTKPNSGLGKAISYLLNHWLKLTLFLRQAGAPIDNNLVEREKGDSESQKRTLLQDAERHRSRRSVHESDPYLRAERSQSVRAETEAFRRDAWELPRDAGATRRARSGVVG
jgi:Transposase IS66 family